MRPIPRSAVVLSFVSFACAAAASVATLVWRGSFPQPPAGEFNAALAEARGWSAVTLGLALPLFAIALRAAARGSLAGRLAWLGTLAYLVYTYLELAVSPPFTALYLLYVVAFACAIPALVIGVSSVDARATAAALGDRAPRRGIIAFSLVMGIGLTLAWTKDIVARTAAGDFGWPTGVAAIGHVVHALDLGLQVPFALATALLLLRRRPGGSVAAAIMLVNGVCMGAALTAMVAVSSVASDSGALAAAPFAIIPLVATLLAALFFRALRVERRDAEHAPADGAVDFAAVG